MTDIVKSKSQIIRVSLVMQRGEALADIRTWYDGGDGEYRPTPRGIRVRTSQLDELREALDDLQRDLDGVRGVRA